MEGLRMENIQSFSTIESLKKTVNEKDREIHDIGMSLISTQNDLEHLQSQTQSESGIVNQYQTKLEMAKQQMLHYKEQYEQVTLHIISLSPSLHPCTGGDAVEYIRSHSDSEMLLIESAPIDDGRSD